MIEKKSERITEILLDLLKNGPRSRYFVMADTVEEIEMYSSLWFQNKKPVWFGHFKQDVVQIVKARRTKDKKYENNNII